MKIFTLPAILLSILLLSACSGGGEDSDTPTPPTSQILTWDDGKWDNVNWE